MEKAAAMVFMVIGVFASVAAHGDKAMADGKPQKTYSLKQTGDRGLVARANAVLPKIIKACPGLDQYANDLSPAVISASQMEGYQGGLQLEFKVADRPQSLPSDLKRFSGGHSCYIDVSPDGKRMYLGKRACHSICEGKRQENDPDSMGREFILR